MTLRPKLFTAFFAPTRGIGIRGFDDAVNSDTEFAKHLGDYTLFELGEWDDQSATFNMYPTPISLGLAQQFKRQQEMFYPGQMKMPVVDDCEN